MGVLLAALLAAGCGRNGADDRRPKGLRIMQRVGCTACHMVTGEQHGVGPNLSNVGSQLTPEKIRQKIKNPAAFTTKGFSAGVMPNGLAEKMTPEELDEVVAWLSGLKRDSGSPAARR